MTKTSLSKNELASIGVKEEDDGSFTITWDETDPRLEFLNDWTEEDWIQAFSEALEREDGTEAREGLSAEISAEPSNAKGIKGKEISNT